MKRGIGQETVTDRDIANALNAAAQRQPGVFRKIFSPLFRIESALQAGFAKGFGEAPLTDTPISGSEAFGLPSGVPLLDPIQRGASALGNVAVKAVEGTFRGMAGLYLGALGFFEQSLVEFSGLSDTQATRTTRDLAALSDVVGIASVSAPAGAVMAIAKKVVTKIHEKTGGAAIKEFREGIRQEKAQMARDRALNLAKKEASQRVLARGGSPEEAALRAEMVDIADRKLADIEIRTVGERLIREPDEVLSITDVVFEPVVTQGVLKKAIKVAQTILQEHQSLRGVDINGLAPTRVFQIVADLLNTDDGFAVRLFLDLDAAGVGKGEFLIAMKFTASEAGRTLQQFSRFFDPFRSRALRGDKDAIAALREAAEGIGADGKPLELGPRLTPFEAGQGFWLSAGRLFRKSIITLPVTAARNFIDSGMFRTTLSIMQKEMDNTFRRMFTPNSPIREPVGSSFELLGNIYGSIRKDAVSAATGPKALGRFGVKQRAPSKVKQQLDAVMDAYPWIRKMAFSSLDADVLLNQRRYGVMGKAERWVDKWLLALNRTQEFIIRRGVLAARLDLELRKVGSSLDELVDTGNIPAGFNRAASKAIEETLFHTFALPPKAKGALGEFFLGYATMIEKSRVLVFLEPFPRFIFNATKLIMESTATGGLRLMRPVNRAKLAEGDFSPLAREMAGNVMLATAYAIRTGEFPGLEPGARFDEVLVQGKARASLAPFATIIPHLFIADLIIRINEGRLQELSFKDFRQGLLSSAPQAQRATDSMQGLWTELLQIDTEKKYGQIAGEFAGEIGTGYLRFTQLFRDFFEEWDEAYELQRAKRGFGARGPIQNLLDPTGRIARLVDPEAKGLPELQSPTRGETPRAQRVKLPFDRTISSALFSHISGIRIRPPRNTIEREIVFLGFRSRHLNPKMGNARLNDLVNTFQGPFLETLGEILLTTDLYKSLPVKTQTEMVRNIIGIARGAAIEISKQVPGTEALFLKRRFDSIPNIKLRAIEEQMDILLRSRGSKLRFADLMRGLKQAAMKELEAKGL